MTHFNFARLIKKYSRDFTLITKSEGEYNAAGDYIKGDVVKTTLRGAIMGFSEQKLYRSQGTLTTNDKTLHMLEPINEALMNATVIFDNEEYRIETQKGKGNASFTGVYSYTLKFVSAFGKKEGGKNV